MGRGDLAGIVSGYNAASLSFPPAFGVTYGSDAFLVAMSPFDFYLPTRIVFAAGAVKQLGTLARELGAKRVLMVSDTGVVKAGHFQSVPNHSDGLGTRSRIVS